MRFRLTAKQVFAIVSLGLITVIGVTTSVSEAIFFPRAIIERESKIIDELVDAIAVGTDSMRPDMQNFSNEAMQKEFTRRFSLLGNLPGVVQIKVFNRERAIVWSDHPALIGTRQTRHPESLERAFGRQIRTEYSQLDQIISAIRPQSPEALIEFYVPFSWQGIDNLSAPVDGVVALYRSPKDLNATILNGLLLLWVVTFVGGGILFVAIYTLYGSIYKRQQSAELKFAELTKEQERIIQIEKLSAVGQMVTEIAHQLNNPLVGVVNLAALAEREVDNPERLRELLRDVQSAGKHCRDFVQRMLKLNAAARSEPKPTDLVELTHETAALFRQSFTMCTGVVLELPSSPVVLELDPVLMRHALFNLLHNAALADPEGRPTVTLSLADRKGIPGCVLVVSDRGAGISPEIASKLFTPFFTTRTGGTGLGLFVAQQIVVRHGGTLIAENRVDHGARFVIWLPLPPHGAGASNLAEAPVSPP
jgi:signal transduction histidine kinase